MTNEKRCIHFTLKFIALILNTSSPESDRKRNSTVP